MVKRFSHKQGACTAARAAQGKPRKGTACLAAILSVALAFCVPVVPTAYAEQDTASDVEGNPILIPADKVVTPSFDLDELDAILSEGDDEADTASGAQTYSSMAMLASDSGENTAADGTTNTQVIELYGDMQYDTAAAEALYSFTSSEYAIIANGITGVDALSATALAGALECPILLASFDYLPSATEQALKTIGVTKPILVGGTAALSEEVASEVQTATGGEPLRLWGNGILDTQLDIFRYGQENNLWNDMCLIAQGVKSYADALSFSPVAYKMKAPVFLVNDEGLLPESSQEALKSGNFTRA